MHNVTPMGPFVPLDGHGGYGWSASEAWKCGAAWTVQQSLGTEAWSKWGRVRNRNDALAMSAWAYASAATEDPRNAKNYVYYLDRACIEFTPTSSVPTLFQTVVTRVAGAKKTKAKVQSIAKEYWTEVESKAPAAGAGPGAGLVSTGPVPSVSPSYAPPSLIPGAQAATPTYPPALPVPVAPPGPVPFYKADWFIPAAALGSITLIAGILLLSRRR
jgi:hypothetical protein